MIFNKEKLFLWITIIDILFLTYLPFIALSLSFLIILPWVFINIGKLQLNSEWKSWIVFILFSILSCVIGIFMYPADIYTNVKATFIFLTSTLYYFYFRENVELINKGSLVRVFYIFMIFGAILATIYLINTSLFSSIKNILNPYDGIASTYLSGGLLGGMRYNFLWTDANNVAYMFSAITIFLLIYDNYSFPIHFVAIACNAVILIATMSTGGMGAFAIAIALYVITNINKLRYVRVSDIFFVALLILLVAICSSYMINQLFTDGSFVMNSIDRATGNSLDSRIARWTNILSNTHFYDHVIFGEGANIHVQGQIRAPHSGVLYLLYCYGGISLILFIRKFIVKPKGLKLNKSIYMIPIIIGFLINTLITNPKIMGIICLLAVITKYWDTENRNSEVNRL